MEETLKKLFLDYNLGNVISVKQIFGGFMNKMYKVVTNEKTFVVKKMNPELMKKEEVKNNLITSEKISNFANKNNIPVCSAMRLEEKFLLDFNDGHYMIFNFIEGKTLTDEEIKIEHCKKIGIVLGQIHSLDYKSLGLEQRVVTYKRLYEWDKYIQHENFKQMKYRSLYLENYEKLNIILDKANKCFNSTNRDFVLCHKDMDSKNVMWENNNPIIIDWECAGVASQYRDLIETAINWSGFLSNNFDIEKYEAVINGYREVKDIDDINWYDVVYGNLVGRIGWLKFNVERSLGIVSDDKEEMALAENEVEKTIIEINNYIKLIDTFKNIDFGGDYVSKTI